MSLFPHVEGGSEQEDGTDSETGSVCILIEASRPAWLPHVAVVAPGLVDELDWPESQGQGHPESARRNSGCGLLFASSSCAHTA